MYKNEALKELISIPRDGGENRLWLNSVENRIFILNEKRLLIYSDGDYKAIAEFPEVDIAYSFFARNKKDIFLITSDGLLHHNGTDTKQLYDTGAQPRAVLFENDVFFFANDYDAGTNLIYHGTLTSE